MPVNSYECLFLLDPTKTATDMDGVRTQLHHTLEKYGVEIIASRKWDDRKLAYPIKGHKKGLYYLTYFRSEGKSIVPIEHDIALNEMILRSQILKIEAGQFQYNSTDAILNVGFLVPLNYIKHEVGLRLSVLY